MSRCEDIMTPDPLCCVGTDSVQTAAQKLHERNVGALPVIDGTSGKLVGIVTDRDLALRVIGNGLDPASTVVASIMTTGILTCHPNDPLEKVMAMMSEAQIRRVPVVDDDEQVVGIVAQADLATRLHEQSWAGAVVRGISQPDPMA